MVESQIVVLVVAGSSPVGHPPIHFRLGRGLRSEQQLARGLLARLRLRLDMSSRIAFREKSEPRRRSITPWLQIGADENLPRCHGLKKLLAGETPRWVRDHPRLGQP